MLFHPGDPVKPGYTCRQPVCPRQIYVQRIGRTGRIGNRGEAITFIEVDKERRSAVLVAPETGYIWLYSALCRATPPLR